MNENLIHNTEVSATDANLAFHIYGKDPAVIMGKTRRRKPPVVPTLTFIPLPDSILKLYQNVTIPIDIFFINGVRFFHSISDNIKMQTVEALPKATKNALVSCTKRVINLYQSRGFRVVEVKGDGQFKCLEEHINN